MPTITHGDGRVTMINVFALKPEDRERLIEILADGIRRVTSRQPGFVSASIHTSLDGTRVANYVQWEGRDAYERLFRDPEMLRFMDDLKEQLRFAHADASPYEVRMIITPPGAPG
jgi:quinol monooxygenase YgiN